ncbi:GNAT family N-acetyltransferase [Actinoplanes sp. L3-i22]|uniref:GNAT family N-acetyltransferase n=1 Tax=Actinoplanes sp. L3-i22 TaxID=2836373 RepID=UPI001C77D3FF|nr:GNAT family N-acetyltransferase [Actinoplanes sp. L3-i22]BCY14431.1 N-acetyltransferase [Actinoplanes sp. L3-i22]
MTESVIRALTSADVDAVAEVHVRGTRAANAGIMPAAHLAALDPAVFAARRRTDLARFTLALPGPTGLAGPGRQTVVAVRDDRVIGFAGFGPDREDPRLGELYAIYVDPDAWGSDAGRLLFETARHGLASPPRGPAFPAMRLWVLAGNARARRFYERAGMTTDGVTVTHRAGAGIELPKLRYTRPL